MKTSQFSCFLFLFPRLPSRGLSYGRLVFLLLSFTGVLQLPAQNRCFHNWSINEGLPSSVIYCMKQDQRGYLWFGTENGVCSFDGKKFRSFTKKDGLTGNRVRSIFEDSKGRLWFGTNGGVTLYDGKSFRKLTKKNGLTCTAVLCFLEDYKNNICVGTDDRGLCIITEVQKDSFKIKSLGIAEGLSNNSVFGLYEDKEHCIWVATLGGGINILQPEGDSYKIKIVKGPGGLPSDLLIHVSGDGKGNIWFGTYDAGAFRIALKDKGKADIPFEQFKRTNGLNSNSVGDILTRADGSTWFGTWDNGINCFFPDKGNSPARSVSYTRSQGLCGNQIYCLLEDREHNLWIGSNGDGLSMLPGNVFAHYTMQDGLPDNKILAIAQDTLGNFWLASSGGGLSCVNMSRPVPVIKQYSEKEGFPNNFTTAVATGKGINKNIWTGTVANGIVKYNGQKFVSITEKDDLISNRVYSLLVDNKGILWVGTSNGISRFDGASFENISTEKMKMSAGGVKSILQDKTGTLWFGTAGGLARYTENKTLRTFDEAEGLAHININTLVEDEAGNIWIGTDDGGIYQYRKDKPDSASIVFIASESLLGTNSIHSLLFTANRTLLVGTNKGFVKLNLDEKGVISGSRSYDASDGFQGVECNDNAICKDPSGDVWFGTANGLTRYAPRLEEKSSVLPTVHLTGIQLFFKEVDWATKADTVSDWFHLPKNIHLPYTENHLTFQFAGIAFANVEKTKYKYLLEGHDKEWSPLSAATSVTFSGLPKGTYSFKVVAVDASGTPSEPEVFTFTITPPWYETKLFYGLALMTIIGSVYFFIKFRERKLIEEKRVLEQIVTERTQEVVEQKEHIAEKNKEITDSITYAKRIQTSILPNINEVRRSLTESFILFKPKDIVSGDFYWFKNVAADALHPDAAVYIAAADCTGHGVPGAFMSTIGVEKLNEAIKQCYRPGEILSFINKTVKNSLQQSHGEGSEDTSVNDGMDVALLQFQFTPEGATVHYSAANRPLYLIRKDSGTLEETKANKTAIGGHTEEDQVFDTHTFRLNKGDTCYLSSDGYADQFGADDKKLMTRNFKNLLVQIQDKSMEEQREFLSNYIETWRGDVEQTDDVLVIGVRVN